MGIVKNIQDVLQTNSSTLILTLISVLAILAIIVALIKFKKVNITPRLMAFVALSVAMSTVLSFFKLFELPWGGSATLGSMVPIIFMSYLYGPVVGVFTGFLYGILNFVIGPAYVMHPIQVLFDYTLPFMCVGLAGIVKNNKVVGTLLGFALKFACHFISGVVFFASYAPEGMSPIVYSTLYNGSYCGADFLICAVIVVLLRIDVLARRVNANQH